MFSVLAKIFIKDNKNYKSQEVLEGYGKLSGVLGIILNVLLFAGKFIAGFLTGAISVTADAFNNLSDAGSSLVTFIGFKLSSKKSDKDHPFGHGRMEYVAGFIVSMIIFVVGYELIKESVQKLINPQNTEFSQIALIILAASVLIKLYMFIYNRQIAKKINSATMRATALDSINDCIATLVVALSLIANELWGWQIDGITGILVALVIIYNGVISAKEIVGLLLGEAPEAEYVAEIERAVLAQPGIIGVHDLIVHNYGPGRQIISLHAEVDSMQDVNAAHEQIDNAEQVLEKTFGCIAVIHTDPIVLNDGRRDFLMDLCKQVVKQIDPEFSIHDFRMTAGEKSTNLIFDVTITHDTKLSEENIIEEIQSRVKKHDESLNCVCKIEHSFTNKR